MKKQTADAQPHTPLDAGLRRYYLLTSAVAGAAVMNVEILGAKVLSPFVGTSHFVWTAQITVTLLALATGYAFGGWLVDRSPRPRWLYAALLASGLWLAAAVGFTPPVAIAALKLRLAVGSLVASAALYFVPLALMAMTGPFLVRLLTQSVSSVGTSAGRLTAISTLGSVAGTVASSYFLTPYMANSHSLLITAGALVLLAVVYYAVWDRAKLAPGIAASLLAGGVGFFAWLQDPYRPNAAWDELYRGNSNFGLLQVIQDHEGSKRYYLNDWLTQNTYEPANHRSLSLFTYMLEQLAESYTTNLSDALCIGMGVGIVPGRLAALGAKVDVVEINPAIVPVAQRHFDLDTNKFQLHIGDGRVFLHETQQLYDAVVVDAFLGDSPPSHLMTVEAFTAIKERLKPAGILVMNTFGGLDAKHDYFTGCVWKTLHKVFPSVRMHTTGNGNIFFVASPDPAMALRRAPDFSLAPTYLQSAMQYALERSSEPRAEAGRVLTDNFNPVDYFDAANREEIRAMLAKSHTDR